MKSVLKLTGKYKGIPKYWVEFLHRKFGKIEGTPIQRERKLEAFLDGVAEMLKDPYVVKVGNCEFSKIMKVEEVKLPVGYRLNRGSPEYGRPVFKEYRFGFTSDGTIVGSHSRKNEPISLNWSYLDEQFYVAKNKNDMMVFWHQAFMEKVKDLMGEAHTNIDGVLESQNRFAGDDPRVILSEEWLQSMKLRLAAYVNMKAVNHTGNRNNQSSYRDILTETNETIRSIVGDGIATNSGRSMFRDMSPVEVLVDRYVDWALVKGVPLENILNYTLSELFEEFWVEVETKADKLRDEFLKRYGFESFKNPEAVAKLALPTGRLRYNAGVIRNFEGIWNGVGWFKVHKGNVVFISGDGSVCINDRRICIIGEKNDSFLPVGDKIVQMVVAVGTKLRNKIYTLNQYRPMLEEMFKSEKEVVLINPEECMKIMNREMRGIRGTSPTHVVVDEAMEMDL